MARQRVSSGSPYEIPIGISRATRVGNVIAVSGTAPLGADGNTVGAGDGYAQTKRCLEIISGALKGLGSQLQDVTRTRVYLVDMNDWKEVARAHGEVFGQIRPASTFVQVSRFIDPEWLVEIEADAVCE
jgi:enamine deaminase RidA (YjgF/YER057c/UK114 family)